MKHSNAELASIRKTLKDLKVNLMIQPTLKTRQSTALKNPKQKEFSNVKFCRNQNQNRSWLSKLPKSSKYLDSNIWCSMSEVNPDFMCPLQGKGDRGASQAHFMIYPMLTTCCGYSACYDCIKAELSR